MLFSEALLAQLEKERRAVPRKYYKLSRCYLNRKYVTTRALEYARHGLVRRVKILVRCIERVFDILQPSQEHLPAGDELSNAAINIQAFVFNVFGSLDNLAWIWVAEKSITRSDGSSLANSMIGLRKKNVIVRESFSSEFQAYLDHIEPWFHHIESLRHALAHRIPLYVIPYMVPESKKEAFLEFDVLISDALERGDPDEADRLLDEQKRFVAFYPYITHSFEEKAPTIVFHAQMLADLSTIDYLAWKMVEELGAAR